MTNTLSVERRAALERQAQAIGYDLDYQPEVMMEDIRLLPESFWHENRAKGWGGSNEGVLNGISKFSSMPELVNEKLLNRKAEVDDDRQYIFDFGHALEWVMLKRYAAMNSYKFLTYIDYFVLVRTNSDLSLQYPKFRKAQEGLYSYVTRDEKEANELLAQIKSSYPASFIVKQESNDPKDVRDITAEEHTMYDAKGIVCVDRRQYINPNYRSMIGDMDGLCIEPDGTRRGIECKTYTHNSTKGCFTSGVLGETGKIKNEEYYYQVQHYMAVCNIDRFDIVATCGNTPNDFTITTVYRNVDFEKYLCENAQDAWERYIENLEVPEVEQLNEEMHDNLVASMTPDTLDDEPVEIPAALLENIERIEKINEKIKASEQEIERLEEQIRKLQLPIEEVMSENSLGFMSTDHDYDYQFEFQPGNGRAGFDQKTLKAEMPDVWEKYKKPAEPGKRKFKFFRIKKRS